MRVRVLADWKREGAFISPEYRLQAGAYFGATHCYDKGEGAVTLKPDVQYGMVAHVGVHGVSPKLVMSVEELQTAFARFQDALTLYRYLASLGGVQEPDRYDILGTSYVSVTQVLKHIIAKPGLLEWSYEGGVVAGLQAVGLGVSEADVAQAIEAKTRLEAKTLRRDAEEAKPWFDLKARVAAVSTTAKRDAAGAEGTKIHRLVEYFLKGRSVDLTQAPDWMVKTTAGFAGWCQKAKLEPVVVEQTVYHPDLGYAGTLDTIFEAEAWVVNGATKEGA